MTRLSPEAIAAADAIGRSAKPLTDEQRALVADVFRPLMRRWAAEQAPVARRRAA